VTEQPREPQSDAQASRRGVLAGVGIAGLAGTVSACGLLGSSSSAGGSGYGGAPAGGGSTAAPAGSSAAAGGSATTGASGASGGAGANVLATTSEIPVGGGKIFASAKIVVTQPAAGTFKGFSAICTHMQCTVDQVANGTIDCPCHGSQFSIKDGSVMGGPAPSPLPAAPISLSGTNITLG
jgi:Rieske Fe-S protein